MSHNGYNFYAPIATQVVLNTNPTTEVFTESTMPMNIPDFLSDKVKIDLETKHLRLDVVTEESAPMNSLDHLYDKVKIDPNIPNNKKTFMDMSDCQE